jgi:hypothetical protein
MTDTGGFLWVMGHSHGGRVQKSILSGENISSVEKIDR